MLPYDTSRWTCGCHPSTFLLRNLRSEIPVFRFRIGSLQTTVKYHLLVLSPFFRFFSSFYSLSLNFLSSTPSFSPLLSFLFSLLSNLLSPTYLLSTLLQSTCRRLLCTLQTQIANERREKREERESGEGENKYIWRVRGKKGGRTESQGIIIARLWRLR